MAFMKFFRTIRNNWKKSVVGSIAIFYGGKYALESYDCRQLMRSYCENAKSFGDASIPVDVRPRHLTVILNPAANRRKAKREFEDYCAPLLHLAGVYVNVILTEGEGQARSLAEKLEEATDAIIVAGGDGTLSEVITGIMRRKDGFNVARKIPIGVLPLGRTNTVAKQLFTESCSDHVGHLAEATMAVIKEVTQPLDVIKFQVLSTEDSDISKPVFSVAGLEWGAFRDAHANRDKYWYFGALRGYASYVFTGLKDSQSGVAWCCEANATVSPPCQGCSKCYPERPDLHPEQIPRQSWWSVFGKRNGLKRPDVDYNSITNEDCGKSQDVIISTVDLSLAPCDPGQQMGRTQPPYLQLSYGLSELSYNEYIREGWWRESGKFPTRPVVIKGREIKMWPKQPTSSPQDENTSTQTMVAEKWISIDSENFEERAVRATLLPNMLKMYCSSKRTLN